MKKIISILVLLSVGVAALGQTSVYLLDGFAGPVYYDASKAMEDGDDGEVAVIMIHGWGGGLHYHAEQESLSNALGGAYVISPRFPRLAIFEKRNVADDGRPHWNDSWTADLTTYGSASDDWRGGGDANGFNFSSFDVVDRMMAGFADKKLYPNLKKVVLVGFSAGGQFVSRYVAVGKGKVRRGVKVEYAAMSGSTYLFLNPDAPWLYGLAGRPRYCARTSMRKIMSNLESRRVFYACGELDSGGGSLDRCPPAMEQGPGRRERFENLRKHIHGYPEWEKMVSFHIIPGIAHSAVVAYADPEFVEFVKNTK